MKRRGFTLIELLIVIAIISILSGLSIFGLQGARESARDTRRKSDLELIRSGLELYKSDCGSYPDSITLGGTLIGNGSTCSASNTYIDSIPNDTTGGRNYVYVSSGTPPTNYVLCAALETESGDTYTCGGGCGVTCNYRVANP